eukprot:gene11170-3991_t
MGKLKQLKNSKNPPKKYYETNADAYQEEREKILLEKSKDKDIKSSFKPELIGSDESDEYLSDASEDKNEQIEISQEKDISKRDESDDESNDEITYKGAWSEDEDSSSEEDEQEQIQKEKWKGNDFHYSKQQKTKNDMFNESKSEENEALQLQKKRNLRISKSDVFDDTLQEALENQNSESEEDVMSSEEEEEEIDQKNEKKLTKEEKLEKIMKESPEMIELVSDLKDKLKTIKEHLLPLIKQVKDGELVTKEGLSYLEEKYHLLLNYCIDIVFYLLLKSSGKSVKDHPVISQLVELRVVMEKIRPIDERLKYQINKLVSMATSTETSNVELDHRPNLEHLVEDEEVEEGDSQEEQDSDDSDIYVAPKLMAVSYEEGDKKKVTKKREKLEKKFKHGNIVQTLKDTIGEEPDFDYSVGAEFTKKKTKEDEMLRDIEEYENENFSRVSLNKRQKNMLKKKQKNLITDELSEIHSMNELNDLDKFLRQKDESKQDKVTLLQYNGNEKAAKKALKIDDDEPIEKDEEHVSKREKKRKLKELKQKEIEEAEESNDDDYQTFEPVAKKKMKRDEENRILEEEIEDGKRTASNEIVKNRGLVVKRKKEDKNPRLKLKHKYEKKSSKLGKMRKNPGAYSE